jgi:hypothetical protein
MKRFCSVANKRLVIIYSTSRSTHVVLTNGTSVSFQTRSTLYSDSIGIQQNTTYTSRISRYRRQRHRGAGDSLRKAGHCRNESILQQSGYHNTRVHSTYLFEKADSLLEAGRFRNLSLRHQSSSFP